MTKTRNLEFSFSGLKTAVLYFLKGPGGKRDAPDRPDLDVSRADVAASFQAAVVDVLVTKARRAAAATGATGKASWDGATWQTGVAAAPAPAPEPDPDFESMTEDEIIAYIESHGFEVPDDHPLTLTELRSLAHDLFDQP